MAPEGGGENEADGAAASTRKYGDKEDFVTGHDGTSAHEIFLLCLVIPVGLRLYYGLRNNANNNFFATKRSRWWGGIAIEFFAIVMPMLLVQTSLLTPHKGPSMLLVGMMALEKRSKSERSDDDDDDDDDDDECDDDGSVHRRTQRSTTARGQRSTTTAGDNRSSSSTTTRSPPPPLHNERVEIGDDDDDYRRPAFLSIYRSCVYVLTTIAILAVDFPIFPRRFCKTEVGGYGWMDLGAASFVIVAGWSSALSSLAGSSTTPESVFGSARRAFKKCAPLLFIGLIRLAANKGLEYQEHVSEYGVHWNFFFTLCCVEGFVVAWKGLKRLLLGGSHAGRKKSSPFVDSILAFSMMVPYQLFLSAGGGQDFVENGARTCADGSHRDIVSLVPDWLVSREFHSSRWCDAFVANREGILGVVGYLSLRLLSEDVARVCLVPPGDGGRSDSGRQRQRRLDRDSHDSRTRRRLLAASLASWTAHLCLTLGFGMPNSRRSTNAPFVLWSLAHNLSLLCMIHHVMTGAAATAQPGDGDGKRHHSPRILETVNRFGLAVFLLSNVLTGLANLTVDTLHSGDGKAMFVLTIYLVSVCGIALLLDSFVTKKKKKMA